MNFCMLFFPCIPYFSVFINSERHESIPHIQSQRGGNFSLSGFLYKEHSKLVYTSFNDDGVMPLPRWSKTVPYSLAFNIFYFCFLYMFIWFIFHCQPKLPIFEYSSRYVYLTLDEILNGIKKTENFFFVTWILWLPISSGQ